ncbi:hypothetical protein JY97_17750, partial [Alkalispirochaeta odontotermitis]
MQATDTIRESAIWIGSYVPSKLITGYAKAILKKKIVTLVVGGVLVLFYAYLYILLQLEDYALLMGSIGLFAVLSVIMYLTRRIERSDSTIRQSTSVIRHSLKFHTSAASGQKNGQSDQRKETNERRTSNVQHR